MAQSLSKILLHLVFSTKNRANIIPNAIENKLHAYLAGVCRANGSNAFRVGGTANHVHIACTLPRTMTISKLLEEIKKSSYGLRIKILTVKIFHGKRVMVLFLLDNLNWKL